jgi:hypothetical protein
MIMTHRLAAMITELPIFLIILTLGLGHLKLQLIQILSCSAEVQGHKVRKLKNYKR